LAVDHPISNLKYLGVLWKVVAKYFMIELLLKNIILFMEINYFNVLTMDAGKDF
jgi:hypothetical protein